MCRSTSLYTLIWRYAPSCGSAAALTPLEFTPRKTVTTRTTDTARSRIFEILGIVQSDSMGTSPRNKGLDVSHIRNDIDKMILSNHRECAGSRYNTLVAVGRIELPTYGL